MKTKEIPVYTNVIVKGKALKVKACQLYSFSEKEKQQMKYFCDKLVLSESVYEMAKDIYLTFLKTQLDVGIRNPTPVIAASVHIASVMKDEIREELDLEWASGKATTTSTIKKYKKQIINTGELQKIIDRETYDIYMENHLRGRRSIKKIY